MPTAVNKAQVYAVMGWTYRFTGFYALFRQEQKAYVITNNIRGPKAYGTDNWKEFMDLAAKSQYFIMKQKYAAANDQVTCRLD